jgi:predicted transglutaminase-like cysteine proteinase
VQAAKFGGLGFFLLPNKTGLLWFCGLVVFITSAISSELTLQIRKQYGEQAERRFIEWEELLQTAKNLPDLEKLQRANRFFNENVVFVNDIEHWKTEDYWATPIEFLATGGGDCEDFAIAKYFTLKQLGVDESKMRITYVKAFKLNQAHMVLTYFENPKAVPLVLDNLIPAIEPATKRRDLIPVYSFNGDGLWLAKSRGSGKRLGNAERLNLWQELNQRMQSQ